MSQASIKAIYNTDHNSTTGAKTRSPTAIDATNNAAIWIYKRSPSPTRLQQRTSLLEILEILPPKMVMRPARNANGACAHPRRVTCVSPSTAASLACHPPPPLP